MEKRRLPQFKDEAEEARWWYGHRDELASDMINAMREGRTGPGSVARLRAKLAAKEKAAEQVAISHSSKNAA